MFNELIDMFEINPIRAYINTIGLIIIFALIIWVSLIDIKKKEVEFWKLLITSGMIIIIPIISSFFSENHSLKYFLFISLILWVLFLGLNIKFNNDKFIGKADIDILSSIFALLIMCSLYLLYNTDYYVGIQIIHLWYLAFLYLLYGSLIFLVIIFIYTFIKSLITKQNMLNQLKGSKISMIPVLIPISILIPYNIMIF